MNSHLFKPFKIMIWSEIMVLCHLACVSALLQAQVAAAMCMKLLALKQMSQKQGLARQRLTPMAQKLR